ncbi:MAG: hypothetical protein QY312_03070 [Candidatus Dojkabacteria bacterium]|nr:MAG: hypothetical protein QY312_03070 [Candidatus Dojkabacteria bacterium]
MISILRKIGKVTGVLSLILPVIIMILWYTYVREQEGLYSAKTTEKFGCEPYGMIVSREKERMVIMWETKEECSGFLLLGTSYAEFSGLPYKVLSEQGEAPARSHKVTLLKQDEIAYRYAIIVSAGEWYGISGRPIEL